MTVSSDVRETVLVSGLTVPDSDHDLIVRMEVTVKFEDLKYCYLGPFVRG